MQEKKQKFKALQEKYEIKLKEDDKLPYKERIQRDCNMEGFYYEYKSKQVEKESKVGVKQQPFHLGMLRREQEKKAKEELLEAKKRAFRSADYQKGNEQNKGTEEEELTKEMKLMNWILKKKASKLLKR